MVGDSCQLEPPCEAPARAAATLLPAPFAPHKCPTTPPLQATASATATAVANATVTVITTGNASGCGSATASGEGGSV